MGFSPKGTFKWLLMPLLLLAEPVLAGRSFVIEKEKRPSGDPLTPKTFDDALTRTCPSREWAKASQLDTFFPQQGAPYEIVLNLKLFDLGSLPNINNFLIALSQHAGISQRTPALTLVHGTSRKFNLLFPGIGAYFKFTPHAQVFYHQGGTQTPKAAEMKLNMLSPVKSPLCPSRVSEEEMREGLSALTLNDSGGHTISQVGDVSQTTSLTGSPEHSLGMLQQAIKEGELRETEDRLKARWIERNGGTWPPLGITTREKIVSIDSKSS